MDNKLKALELLIVATIGLGACQPAPGTPQAVVGTQVPASTTPLVQTAVSPDGTLTPTPAPPVAAASFKSQDPTTLTYLTPSGDPDTLDPAFDYETSGGQVIQNTYDSLIFYNRADPNRFVPQLATQVPSQANGGISADGRTYTFKIRVGVKFHNGDILTPDDVAFTFQRGLLQGGLSSPQWLLFQPILGLAASPSGNNDITDLVDASGKFGDKKAELLAADPAKLLTACQAVTSAIVADRSAGTVTFHLAQPWGPFLEIVANAWGSISDEKWVAANGGWNGDCRSWQAFYQTQSADINKLGIGKTENGTGPYVLDHWTVNKEVVLKAFGDYWRTAPAWDGGPSGAPQIKTVIIRTVTQFANRLAILKAGGADFNDPDLGVPANWLQMDPLVGETCNADGTCGSAPDPTQPLRVFKGLQSIARGDLYFNFKIDTTGGNDFIGSGKLDGNGIPPNFFADAHVRKAFNYCFDWTALIKEVHLGEGVQSYDVMLPGEIGYSDQDPHYSFDPDQCKLEFQTADLKSADGRSLWDIGFRLNAAYNAGVTARQTILEILSRDLAAVNPKFVLQVISLPWPTYLAAQQAHKLPIFQNGWMEDIHDPNDWLVPYVTGSIGAFQSLPPDLVSRLSDLIGRGVAETDSAQRAVIYKQFNQAFYDAAPDILLAVGYNRHYVQRWVRGYYYNPIYSGYYFYALSKE